MIVSDNGCELTSVAVLRWSPGGSTGTTLRRASRRRMPSSNRSIAACATNALTSMYS